LVFCSSHKFLKRSISATISISLKLGALDTDPYSKE